MKYLSRLTALLLALVLLFSSSVGSIAEANLSDLTRSSYDQMVLAAQEAAEAEAAAAALEAAKQPIINEGGVVYAQDIPEQTKRFDIYEVITDAQLAMGGETAVTLPQSGKINLSAGTAAQWQIYIPGADMWVNIAGETGDTFALTYAVIGGMLSGGAAKVRALAGDSAAVANVSVAYGSALPPVEEEETFAAEAASTFALRRDANAGIMLAAEGDEEKTKRTVAINYKLNGEDVATPYIAEIGVQQSFGATVLNPSVVGYKPTMQDAVNVENATVTFTEESVVYSVTPGTADVVVNIVYQPALVNFTVVHKRQNVENDQYTEYAKETKQALTGTAIKDYETEYGELAEEYDGFYSLLYNDEETVAADGRTVIEIYYDRYYYLMNFELGENGYGTEPIYARYGADLGKIPNPTRAGYTFKGWAETADSKTAVPLPTEMPAGNVTYYAIWEANPTAKVSVVFWGENPNDEEYSYLQTGVVEVAPGTEYTFADGSTVFLICGKEEHEHTAKCGPICGKDEHTKHTEECLGACTHGAHTLDCYQTRDYYTLKTGTPGQTINATVDGVYSYTTDNGYWEETHYYLYLNGTWYCYYGNYSGNKSDTQSINLGCNHTHTDACYSCEPHEHTAACYSCGLEVHTHDNTCNQTGSGLDSTLWKFVSSETVTVAADGSSVINVKYDRVSYNVEFHSNQNCTNEYTSLRITAKWGESIVDEWPTYNRSSSWLVQGKSNTWQNGIQVMPVGGAKFWGPKSGSSSYKAYYYVEALPGATDTITHNGVTYVLHHTDTSVSSGDVTAEEQYAIEGFTYKEGTSIGSSYSNAKFYYTRHRYAIEFYSPTTLLQKTTGVAYQAPLTSYNWTPDSSMAPVQYEPGSVAFEGWYLNPECTGEKFDFSTKIMPAAKNDGDTAITLYAKWVPVSHTVTFYLDYDAYVADTALTTPAPQTVEHGSLAKIVAKPDNGAYKFIGWFYMDEGVEKAFDFANMPIKQDMKVYAKWGSDVLKEYSVFFKVQGTDTEVADSIKGSALAGAFKTFDAKGGEELYEGFREGFFPLTQSHSITLDIDDDTKNTFTFWYVEKSAVPYTVKYVAAESGEELLPAKVVADNKKAVVTEQFVPINGRVPDAFQKRLVIDGTDGAVNEIIFYYTEDTKHAYYQITHYTQGVDGTWNEYTSTQAMGDIGTTYSADQLEINGFTYDPNAEDDALASGVLTENGLDLKMYYTRNQYPYKVKYLLYGTEGTENEVHLKPEKTTDANGNTLKDVHGKMVAESAIDIENYEIVGDTAKTLTIRIEDSIEYNVFTFLYQEKLVNIKYEVVGPEGCGFVTPATETIKVLTGEAQGSTATASSNAYKFIGWYDADGNLLTEELSYVPAKVNGKNVAATYYAKFEWNLADLTISKSGLNQTSGNDRESAIFVVADSTGKEIATVVIPGNGSVVIGGLTVGETYTVTELNSWTWRYSDQSAKSVTINPPTETTEVTFANSQTNNSWLGGDNYKTNKFN